MNPIMAQPSARIFDVHSCCSSLLTSQCVAKYGFASGLHLRKLRKLQFLLFFCGIQNDILCHLRIEQSLICFCYNSGLSSRFSCILVVLCFYLLEFFKGIIRKTSFFYLLQTTFQHQSLLNFQRTCWLTPRNNEDWIVSGILAINFAKTGCFLKFVTVLPV